MDDVVKLELVSGSDLENDNLGFTWQVSTFTKQTMDISLVFDKPLFVSSQSPSDQLSVTFKSSEILLDEDNLAFEEDVTLFKKVPTQYADANAKKALEKTRELLDSGT